MIKFTDLLNEWNNGGRKIIAIFPGESKNNPHIYYYECPKTNMIYKKNGRVEVVIADDFDDFKNWLRIKELEQN